jgi:hypothetical protein
VSREEKEKSKFNAVQFYREKYFTSKSLETAAVSGI